MSPLRLVRLAVGLLDRGIDLSNAGERRNKIGQSVLIPVEDETTMTESENHVKRYFRPSCAKVAHRQ